MTSIQGVFFAMAILRRGPMRTLRQLEQQLDDVFSGNGSERDEQSSTALTKWSPRVDVYEEGDELVFELDAPGVDKEDLDVSLDENRLIVSGERREEKDVQEGDRNYFRSERVYGQFKRSFALPEVVETDQIEANFDEGVLTIRVPKREDSPSRSIEIN